MAKGYLERWKVEGRDVRGALVSETFLNKAEAMDFSRRLTGPVAVTRQQLIPVRGTGYVDWKDVIEPKSVERADADV